MKKFYIFIILCVIAFGLTAAFVAHIRHANEESLDRQEALWNLEKEAIQAELEALKVRMEELKSNVPEQDTPELEPKALIARLRDMKDWFKLFGDKAPPLRKYYGDKVIHNETLIAECHDQLEESFFIFQGLQNQGDKSLDAIRDYLTSGDNIVLYDYSRYVAPSNRTYTIPVVTTNIPLNRFKRTVYNIDPVPETSRLGLIYTLGSIKTPAALELLYQSMQSSRNLREIISAGNLLLDADKGSFTQPVLAVYKAYFPVCDREEQNSLLAYIKKISEKDFNEIVQALTPFDEDGKLSMDIFSLKMDNLGEAGIPFAYEAFNRPDATLVEKINIVDTVRKFIGSNEQANSMFTSLLDGLTGIDKDWIGSVFIKNITENTKEKEKQQQFLNLLGHLQLKQDDPPFFLETVELMKETLAQKIEQGENFDEKEYQHKLISTEYSNRMSQKYGSFTVMRYSNTNLVNTVMQIRGEW